MVAIAVSSAFVRMFGAYFSVKNPVGLAWKERASVEAESIIRDCFLGAADNGATGVAVGGEAMAVGESIDAAMRGDLIDKLDGAFSLYLWQLWFLMTATKLYRSILFR